MSFARSPWSVGGSSRAGSPRRAGILDPTKRAGIYSSVLGTSDLTFVPTCSGRAGRQNPLDTHPVATTIKPELKNQMSRWRWIRGEDVMARPPAKELTERE